MTKDEAVNQIIDKLSQEDRDYLLNIKKEELIILHSSFGRTIRNEFKLWEDNNPIVEECCNCNDRTIYNRLNNVGIDIELKHADHASMVIIVDVWEMIREKIK